MTNNRVSPLNTGPMLWLMASVFVVALGYGVALPLLPFFLKPLLADSGRFSLSSHVGMLTGIYAFAMFLIERWPIHLIAPPAYALMAGGLALLPAASDIGWLFVVVALVAAGSGLLAPIMSYRISLAAGSAQGAVQGRQAAASSLGQAAGSVVAGFGFGLMNQAPFWATAVLLLIGTALSAGLPLFSAQPATDNGT